MSGTGIGADPAFNANSALGAAVRGCRGVSSVKPVVFVQSRPEPQCQPSSLHDLGAHPLTVALARSAAHRSSAVQIASISPRCIAPMRLANPK